MTESVDKQPMAAQAADPFKRFWNDQAEWSRATFGSDEERGPMGPLKHLAREVLTELLGIERDKVIGILAYAVEWPEALRSPVEYADLLFLLFDSARRAGLTPESLIATANQKLAVNRARKWDRPQWRFEKAQYIPSRTDEDGRAAAGYWVQWAKLGDRVIGGEGPTQDEAELACRRATQREPVEHVREENEEGGDAQAGV